MKLVRIILSLGFLAGLTPLTVAACTSEAADVCDALCACERCTPNQDSACKDRVKTARSQADDYNCKSQFDNYAQCRIARGVCNGGVWGVAGMDCNAELQLVQSCEKAASATGFELNF